MIHKSPSEKLREQVVVIRAGLNFWSQKLRKRPEAQASREEQAHARGTPTDDGVCFDAGC